ncbi:hypothetical protein LOTGIDRAFT_170115 [Lottia gigantea]|uniref:Ig-like domain-containing protein n=1 Tax=Lottia gigantea TaxID=225164 RepID=V3ZJ35_LOTGI|nr:hypothetical protein LOTGIDRAFT_170115 [Lottia gigantea]ESO82335.1 hypothetical protein LOTGIDRAFT_170115 [Lottia gigantea]
MAITREMSLWRMIFVISIYTLHVSAQYFKLRGATPYSSVGSQYTMYCNMERGGYPSAAYRVLFRRGDEEMCSLNVKPCAGIESTVSDYFCSCYHGNNTVMYLTIRDVTADDEADWTCGLERYNLKSDKFSLPLYYGPGDSISITPHTIEKHTVNEGNSLAPITCTAQCKPECHLNWRKLRGSGDIVDDDATLISNDSVLYITDVSKSDEGRYVCQASNIIDKNSSVVFVHVNAKQVSTGEESRLSFGVGVGVGIVVCAVVMVTGMAIGIFVYSKVKSHNQGRENTRTESVTSSMVPIYDEPHQPNIFRPRKQDYRIINQPQLPAYEDHSFDLSPL